MAEFKYDETKSGANLIFDDKKVFRFVLLVGVGTLIKQHQK